MTATLTPEGKMTMERTLPISEEAKWDEVSDAFCLLASDAEISAEGSHLTLRWPDCTILVIWRGEAPPVWKPEARGGNWVVSYDHASFAGRDSLTHRWELELTLA